MAKDLQQEVRKDRMSHSDWPGYVWPQDELVRQKLEWFMDQKIGFMVHWGTYSLTGIYESWPMVDEDSEWSRKDVDWLADGDAFRTEYFSLNTCFNPVRFMPEQWAAFAKKAGFRYFTMTTKHHDGFCMYDTKQTDYKVTDAACPFHQHRYANIAKHLFDAFRKEGLGIFAYFSKPDWHCPWYWAKDQALPIGWWRNPTYDPQEKPELWDAYVRFTHAQMMELVEDLGPIDCLWLDGGQVRPDGGQDIRLGELAEKARAVQPGLLFADRTVGGPFENFITPEQQIPESYIPVPWESCVTIGTGFSYRYDDCYKSSRVLVHLLMDVISRNGNLALNLGGQPDGRLPSRGMREALKMGEWLSRNGEAVYGTRPVAPYEIHAECEGRPVRWALTGKAEAGKIYLTLLLPEGMGLPKALALPCPFEPKSVCLTDGGAPLSYTLEEGTLTLTLPTALVGVEPEAFGIMAQC